MQSKSKVNIENIKKLLLKDNLFIGDVIISSDEEFNKIQFNSSKVSKNDIFVCISGFKTDGHNFAEDAFKNGASLLIVQRKLPLKVNQIIVTNSRKACALIANFIYDYPTKRMKLIGITGTNGKTTTSFIIYQSLRKLNKRVGFIGTLGYWIIDEYHSLSRTTPDIIELYKIFKEMQKNKVEIIVMEVSSHSIALYRIYGIKFDIAMITNLSREHLDFHKDMESYAETKFKFLENTIINDGVVVANSDNNYIKKYLSGKMLTMSFYNGDFLIKKAIYDRNESSFELNYFNENYKIKTHLVGKYNIQNVAFAFIAMKLLKLDFTDNEIIEAIYEIKSIPGRLQQYKDSNVFVDFAHTPDALENVLTTLRRLTKKRLIVIIGAGGDRDKGKRSKMTEVCLSLSDLTILTTDNPRTENPENIIEDMYKNCYPTDNIFIQRDRELAIKTGLTILDEDDILLIAGKGHEDYQEINNVKYHFNDLEMVNKYFSNTYLLPKNNLGTGSINLQIPLDSLFLQFLFKTKITNKSLYSGISLDSRTISPDSIFFAIKGDRFDGHKFIKNIAKDCLPIIDDEKFCTSKTVLVDNVLEKLQLLSSKYAQLFSSKRIAITGSFGKTTTKEYLGLILSSQGNILKTYLNENNHIGVPKTLFRTNSSHKYSLIELGSNHPGEIKELAKIANPNTGIITAVGASHIEYFGTMENILKEKISLLEYSEEKIIAGDNEFLFNAVKDVISVGKNKNNSYQYEIIFQNDKFSKIKIMNSIFKLPTIIDSKIEDAVLGIVYALLQGISPQEIQNKLDIPLEIPQRMEIKKLNEMTLIIDCYNANYESMKSAIIFWKKYHPELPHFAILGDMLELGDLSKYYHRKIGKLLSKFKEIAISVGKFSIEFNLEKHFSNVDELIEKMNIVSIPENAVVLIKASHGIHLEKIIERL